MKYILDTHAIIWYFEDSQKLPQKISEMIEAPQTEIFISSASLWEIAIKLSLGKLQLSLSLDELLNRIYSTDCTVLQIENSYLRTLLTLPFIHRDPFDRLIISTAICEGLTIMTADADVQKYNAKWVW